jgi:hypothetical protein
VVVAVAAGEKYLASLRPDNNSLVEIVALGLSPPSQITSCGRWWRIIGRNLELEKVGARSGQDEVRWKARHGIS